MMLPLLQSVLAEPGSELFPLDRKQAGDDQSDLRILAARLPGPATSRTPAQLLPRQATFRRVRLSIPVERQTRMGFDGISLSVTAPRAVETYQTILPRCESTQHHHHHHHHHHQLIIIFI